MRPLLIVMLIFIFLSSFFAGVWMMIDHTGIRSGLERSVLQSTPFQDFFIPGLLIVLFIGLPSMAATLYLVSGRPPAAKYGVLSGSLLSIWIVMQLIIIPDYYTGLSVLYLVTGIMILLMSLQLKGKMVV